MAAAVRRREKAYIQGSPKECFPGLVNFVTLLFFTTSASTCLEHSRNLGSTLLATPVLDQTKFHRAADSADFLVWTVKRLPLKLMSSPISHASLHFSRFAWRRLALATRKRYLQLQLHPRLLLHSRLAQ